MAVEWTKVRDYEEIIYEKYNGIAKVTINRPEKRNAFTPLTVKEMIDAFTRARDDKEVGVIVLAGAGDKAFCSGGDQSVRGHGGLCRYRRSATLKRIGPTTLDSCHP